MFRKFLVYTVAAVVFAGAATAAATPAFAWRHWRRHEYGWVPFAAGAAGAGALSDRTESFGR
jgi:hypothetical protein